MIEAYAYDVGDGMAVGIELLNGKRIQIDCGSQQSRNDKLRESLYRINPNVFILSHFHADHYNGLFCDLFSPLDLDWVYFPRIPEFENKLEFSKCLFAINERILGNKTGSMQMDFLYLLSHHNNRNSFQYRQLSEGDTFRIGSSLFQVLWPPRKINDDETIKVTKKAIENFNSAMEKDNTLKDIYEKIEENKIFHHYVGEQETDRYYEQPYNKQEHLALQPFPRELPKVTVDANKSLRAAANHFSLAFSEDNRLLFLGDLEARELKPIADKLLSQGNHHFHLLITPHHGTHWHSSLSKLKCLNALSTVGPKLFKKLSQEYKGIAGQWCITHLTGDICIPITPPWINLQRMWPRRHWNYSLARYLFPWR